MNEGGRFRGGLRRDEDWATGENVAQGAELKYEQKTLRFSGVEVKEERRGVVMQKTIIIMGFDQARGTRTAVTKSRHIGRIAGTLRYMSPIAINPLMMELNAFGLGSSKILSDFVLKKTPPLQF
ncbi:hypothetical protein RRG08_021170 [Elysia crispata]|uniref:Uncharacterized protein n=1 Tax=Elysia crispata TaxID=231223 RepID=A0AAE1DB26_9GAST|nr:hypothetical protein RRG08_021170 [Elysia crispata]